MITFACNACGTKYEVEDKHAGKTKRCAKCKSTVLVPAIALPKRNVSTSSVVPPVYKPISPQPTVNDSLQSKQPTGIQSFFRAFGITSGFMAAIAAMGLVIPILACGGCLVLLIGARATVDTPNNRLAIPNSTPFNSNQTSEQAIVAIPPASTQPVGGQRNATKIEKPVETVVVLTLPTIDLLGRPNVYPINDMTAIIKDKYINDVRLIDLKQRPVTANVLFENNSGSNWTPRLNIEFVNAYGVLLGYDSISWITSLEPKKRSTETIDFYPSNFDSTFRYSTITQPPDYDIPKYLIIKYR